MKKINMIFGLSAFMLMNSVNAQTTAHMHDPVLWAVQVHQAEWTRSRAQDGLSSEGMAWYGTDAHRAVFGWKAEGLADGAIEAAEWSLAWRKPLSGFWNLDAGAVTAYRKNQPDRTWLMANINGLAPYWFEVNMGLWLGQQGRTLLKIDADYDVRITQRVVLQPKIGLTVYGKADPELGRAVGLAEVESGLRLRYEVSRQVVPYVGFNQTRSLGKSAKIQRDAGEASAERQVVVGLSAMF